MFPNMSVSLTEENHHYQLYTVKKNKLFIHLNCLLFLFYFCVITANLPSKLLLLITKQPFLFVQKCFLSKLLTMTCYDNF